MEPICVQRQNEEFEQHKGKSKEARGNEQLSSEIEDVINRIENEFFAFGKIDDMYKLINNMEGNFEIFKLFPQDEKQMYKLYGWYKMFAMLRELEKADSRFRIVIHEKNSGTSVARETCWVESDSYVIFFDDDVQPQADIVLEYIDAIRSDVHGYVGLTRIPFDGRPFTNALHAASTTYFWHVAEHHQENQPVSWGVGANIMLKWLPDLKFDSSFPKSGRGEDIDMCIRAGGHKGKLLLAASAFVIHPQRNSRLIMWKRMVEQSIGDSMLVDKYPQFSHWTLPSTWTITLLLLLPFPVAVFSSNFKLFISLFTSLSLVWITNVAIGAYLIYKWNFFNLIPQKKRPKGVSKLFVEMETTLVRNMSELGQFLDHISRGNWINLFRRIDFMLNMS